MKVDKSEKVDKEGKSNSKKERDERAAEKVHTCLYSCLLVSIILFGNLIKFSHYYRKKRKRS
jgi:hypothetical protein